MTSGGRRRVVAELGPTAGAATQRTDASGARGGGMARATCHVSSNQEKPGRNRAVSHQSCHTFNGMVL